MIRASICGATGYSGGELLQILIQHPDVTLQHLTSESSPGQDVSAIHPRLRGRLSHRFEKLNIAKIAKDSDVVFSCYPHGVGMSSTAKFVKAGVKVIDLSGDFRLPTVSLFKTWYKKAHPAGSLLKSRVYGLPELFREKIEGASLVANPGCYATAAILAAAPLLKHRLIDPKSCLVDAKSGVSGAGKKLAPTYLFNEANESLQAYSIASHRHQPEIECILKAASRVPVTLTFVPHLIPMTRGILSLFYATLRKSTSLKQVHQLFKETYRYESFVRILPEGVVPQTKNVSNTNYCDIGVFQDKRSRRIIVASALDNLVKGAAGQAVQNMNILFNRPETEGLQ